MEDRIYNSRSPFQKKCSYLIIPVLTVVLVFISSYGISSFRSISNEFSSWCFPILVSACAFHVIFCAELFHSIIVHLEEAKEKDLSLRSLTIYKRCIVINGIFLSAAACIYEEKFEVFCDVLLIIVLDFIFALLLVSIDNLVFDYDDADLSISQNYRKSIGALWAVGAYKSFYELTLSNMIEKITNFETDNNVHIPVRKLIVICPLSCYIQGSLSSRSDRIFYKGNLKVLETDQGANVNRKYKHSVFGVNGSQGEATYVVAEFASPLGTLWEMRSTMNVDKWKYHRDCMIKNLKEFLINYACVVLEYDDQDPTTKVPLDIFMLSSVQQLLEDRSLLM